MTKRDFQAAEYIAEATEQQTSQVGNGPDRHAMNPDVQSAEKDHDSVIDELNGAIEDLEYDIRNLRGLLKTLKARRELRRAKLAQVEHEAKRVAAD